MFALQNAAFGFTFGAYLLEIEEHFGWNKFTISMAFAVSQLLGGLLAPGQGWMIDRFGPRGVLRFGVVLFGLAFMLLSVIEDLWLFYVAVLALGVGSSLSGYLTLHTAVTVWFHKKRALALGISTTGLGLGGLLATIAAWSLVTHGWRATALGSGIVVLAIGLPLCQLLFTRPRDYGLRPDGAPASTGGPAPAQVSLDEAPSFTVREAMRDRSFWLVSAGHGMALVSVFAIIVHLVPHLVQDRGWSSTEAQAMFIPLTATSVVGQLMGGYLGDRYSKTNISALCMLGHSGALLMLAFGEGALVTPAVALQGLAWGTRGPLMTAIRADFFGIRNYATIMGYSLVVVMVGTLIGPSFAGAMSDHFGDYSAAFAIVGAATGVSGIFFLLARKPPLPPRLRALSGSADEER
jgi:MFS family permease